MFTCTGFSAQLNIRFNDLGKTNARRVLSQQVEFSCESIVYWSSCQVVELLIVELSGIYLFHRSVCVHDIELLLPLS